MNYLCEDIFGFIYCLGFSSVQNSLDYLKHLMAEWLKYKYLGMGEPA